MPELRQGLEEHSLISTSHRIPAKPGTQRQENPLTESLQVALF
jgi:hypothetical protein